MKDCRDCIYYERCDNIFDGLLSNRDNKPCDWFDDSAYYAKLPAYIGMSVWCVFHWYNREPEITEGKVSGLQQKADKSWKIRISHRGYVSDYTVEEFKEHMFLTKEAAEESIKKEQAKA